MHQLVRRQRSLPYLPMALLISMLVMTTGGAPAKADSLYSPAGCATNPQLSHPSSTPNFLHTVNHKASLSCNSFVTFKMEVWGERDSWSGWRVHANSVFFPSSEGWGTGNGWTENSGANCLAGTYSYKTRIKAYSLEGGTQYGADSHGPVGRIKRISDPNYWAGYRCAWA